ncbi:MAG TPA: hypothetical protein VKT80_18305 [Chloroflexota bacterium]|nr:hypothetical protein [Chloroflexota bacterium]
MKILYTGFTPLQVCSERAGKVTQKINVPRALRDLLVEDGHEVDWRVVRVGESLRKYDALFVNIGPIQSLNARMGALGSLWALSQYLPTIIHFDDWQVYQVLQQLESFLRLGDKQIFKILGDDGEPFFKVNYDDPELVDKRANIMGSAAALVSPWKRWLALCPMYEWGNKSVARQKLRFVDEWHFSFLDPSSVVVSKYEEPIPEKERAWALASVMPPDYWLEKQKTITWPVHLFGTTKKNVREGRTTPLKTEDDVRREYAKRWGILSPEYPQAGSGWWRSRFIYAAQTGSVLYCGALDAAALGSAYQLSISEIQKQDDGNLGAIAARQAETLRPYIWSRSRLKEELRNVFKRAELLV